MEPALFLSWLLDDPICSMCHRLASLQQTTGVVSVCYFLLVFLVNFLANSLSKPLAVTMANSLAATLANSLAVLLGGLFVVSPAY